VSVRGQVHKGEGDIIPLISLSNMSMLKKVTSIKYIRYIFLFVSCSFLVLLSSAEGNEWGPWDKDKRYERIILQPQASEDEQSFFKKISTFPPQLLITFFQKVISPVDGATCEFYPTCSTYAKNALQKHGLVIGLAMANERVNRYHSPEGYEIIYKFNRYYIYDPVENNDFWFVQKKD
jgi:putative membrane protein insertion efficiency factor